MSNSSSSYDVAVVGGGVIGLTIAWRAAQRGLRVIVLERDEPGHGASWLAAGMIAPVSEALATEQPLLRLGLLSADLYPDFISELAAASGSDPGYVRCGSLLAARDRDEAEWLAREAAFRASLGLTVNRLRASEARALEPSLTPALRGAVEIAEDHAVDPRRLTAALVDAVVHAGGEVAFGAAESLAVTDGSVTGVRLAGAQHLSARQVVIAAGAWSSAFGIPEFAHVPVHPVKGQILRLHDPAGSGLLTRVLRMRTGYVVPRGDGRYVLGATMEERGFDTTVTAGAAFELLRDAIELLPGLSELAIDEFRAGLRPATPDNAPAIGPGAIPGLHWAVGHYRHGILLAPVTAALVVAGLCREELPEFAGEFSPARFAKVAA